jgi:hypothetical protein
VGWAEEKVRIAQLVEERGTREKKGERREAKGASQNGTPTF